MNIEITKAAATQLLNGYYNIHTSDLPTQRAKSEWQDDNKRGFFLGIIQEGETSHTTQLHDLLAANQFAEQQEFSTKVQLADSEHPRTFIDEMFEYYILPFHKNYNSSSSCHTPASSRAPSRTNSAGNISNVPKESELSHRDLKNAVEERDVACLFCWERSTHHRPKKHWSSVQRIPNPVTSWSSAETSSPKRTAPLLWMPYRI
ncbi:hypothetical protein BATDEDRAFT_36544 [Batrachochytrium dendrobatidis JAM81]|uniref:Uncharacterized protein n=1 Tax=Batrachochytrium dendrobatidis (strain JAM81 / FGSC 10211) TaxID=684364 RepID=F4NTW3_BATDJ|nr:uncharacterized protein BATDEDRAFT_36544 [Batrachochytrium dendrobatidis JAM81]EGF84361.1 hypothetical protein BATDEDRAFT_36544 [Batrachochytrium dendrobatidis JAM81]|eukprot:XP_006675898.1 hypothetical protein BATDEDRAFT_36544 [Batrachochytrium dendrobatidis JAM81]